MSEGRAQKRAFLFVLLLAVAAVGGYWYTRHAPEKSATPERIRLFGNVEIREVDLAFRVGGRIASLSVDEGDKVVAGQQIGALETRPFDDRIASAEARIAAASAQLARRENGNRPQQIADANATLAAAQAALREASAQHERRRGLLARGFVSRAEFEASEAALAAARAKLQSATAALSMMNEGERVEDKAASRAEQQAAVADKRAIETDRSDTVLVAPSDGQILTRAREPGAIVQPGETVMTLAIIQPVRVRAYIAEPQLPRVKPGQQVTVTVDGTGKSWPGQIAFVAPVAEFTPKNVETESQRSDLVYRVRILVTDPDSELRQGQPVTVQLAD